MLWYDGAVHEAAMLPFDTADRGLLLGDGVFDTALVLDGIMVWRGAHLRRLAETCDALGFILDLAEVDRALDALLAGRPRGALRITVTRGSGPRGLVPPARPTPKILAALTPLPASPVRPAVSLHVSAIRRNETSPTSRLKTLGYLDAILSADVARRAGFDDALFLNTRDQVACATVGNIVALEGGRVLTPPVADGVLAGVTRSVLLDLCPTLGLEPVERSLTLADLARADAVFVTNSLRLLTPVTRVGSIVKADGHPAVTSLKAALCEAIRAHCGVDPRDAVA